MDITLLKEHIDKLELKIQKLNKEVQLLKKRDIDIMGEKLHYDTTYMSLDLYNVALNIPNEAITAYYDNDNDNELKTNSQLELNILQQLNFLQYMHTIELCIDETDESKYISHSICRNIKHDLLDTVMIQGKSSCEYNTYYQYFGGVLYYIPNMINNMPNFVNLSINKMIIKGYEFKTLKKYDDKIHHYMYDNKIDDNTIISFIGQLEKTERKLKKIKFEDCFIDKIEQNNIREYCEKNNITVQFNGCTN